tara:strand:+ start:1498 stop:1800 length:303 start_codon:yes stop_codon:yes gene_type:complete
MASEKSLQNYLFAQCKKHKIFIRKMEAAGRRGFPDCLLIYKGDVLFAELKSPTGRGRLSRLQQIEINRLQAHCAKVWVLDSREGVDDVIKKITNGKTPKI